MKTSISVSGRVLPQTLFSDPVLTRTFKGNTDTINSCLFNPNMKQAITGSEDGNVFVWNFKPGTRPYKFLGHKGAVNEVTINPFGNYIASCSNDSTIRIWNNDVNGKSQLLKAHTAPIRSIDFSSDGRYILTGSNDMSIKVFSLGERKFLNSYLGHNNWVRSVRFSPDVRFIASGSDDHSVKIWDVTKHSVVETYLDHLQPVNCIRWSPDGTCLSSCSNDKKIKIFDVRSNRVIQHYDAHSAPVTCLSFHPSGKYLLSCSLDSTIKIWDILNGQILYTIHGHEGPIYSVSFSRDGDFISSGGADGTLMIWKNNLSGSGFPETTKTMGGEALSKPVTIPKKRNKSNNKLAKSEEVKLNTNSLNNIPNKNTNSCVINSKFPNISESQLKQSAASYLPPEMCKTFEKMVSQLDMVAKTMKIMDQRIQSLESQVGVLYNKQKKGLIQPQPPEMAKYDYILANSNSSFPQENNFINNVNNNINDNTPHNEIDNEDAENLKDTMNYYDEKFNVKNVFAHEGTKERLNDEIMVDEGDNDINKNNIPFGNPSNPQ